MQFHLFLPQMRMSFERLVETARAAEAAGFNGMAGMDHLFPPAADRHDMYDAMITNTWLAAHTERLKLGSLVLCDSFRHPAVLAKEAVSIDHASGGRYELGIGWGSQPAEFEVFGVGSTQPRRRVQRLRETLEVLRALWAGETVDYDGEIHTLRGAFQAPTPLERIPILIGGAGPRTLELVREFADWWNVPINQLDMLEEARSKVGDVRVSIQEFVVFVGDEGQREAISEAAQRRFGHSKLLIGNPAELLDYYGKLEQQGIERVYIWFTDFAKPDTLAAFGEGVIAPLGATSR